MDEFQKRYKFGVLMQRAGKLTAARRMYESARELRPLDAHLNFNLGALLADLGEPEAALAAFRVAADEGGIADASANVAGLLLKRGDLDGAREACEAALAADPLCEPAVMNLGNVLRRQGLQAPAVDRTWAAIEAAQPGFARPAPLDPSGAPPPPGPPSAADELTVVCVKWGAKYGPEYVNRLAAAVRRHLSAPQAYRFVCLTDDAAGLDADRVLARPLPEGWRGWWNKAALFAPEAGLEGRALYIDLDTVVVGSLDDLAAYRGGFAVLGTDAMANELRAGGLNSSLMAWDASAAAGLGAAVHGFLREHFALISRFLYKFDYWLEMVLATEGVDLFDALVPGQVVEYARACGAGGAPPPPGARLVCFPLQPKPHECEHEEWVVEHWSSLCSSLQR